MIDMHAINLLAELERFEISYSALGKERDERLRLIYKITKERDKYKRALEQIVKSTSGTFRDIAREALNE